MKVKELIEQLQQCNPDADVFVGERWVEPVYASRIESGFELRGDFWVESDAKCSYFDFSDEEMNDALMNRSVVCIWGDS